MTRRLVPALLAGVLALGLAGCSDTKEAVSVTAGPTASAAPPTAPPSTPRPSPRPPRCRGRRSSTCAPPRSSPRATSRAR
ncbi:MAG: hypothetical protein R2734_09210 [Nocardioides sp.]